MPEGNFHAEKGRLIIAPHTSLVKNQLPAARLVKPCAATAELEAEADPIERSDFKRAEVSLAHEIHLRCMHAT